MTYKESHIEITIKSNEVFLETIKINNKTDSVTLNSIITKLEHNTIKGCELIVFLYNADTTDYYRYIYDYLFKSEKLPRKWLLNNILWSFYGDEAAKQMITQFNDILLLLADEYDKI